MDARFPPSGLGSRESDEKPTVLYEMFKAGIFMFSIIFPFELHECLRSCRGRSPLQEHLGACCLLADSRSPARYVASQALRSSKQNYSYSGSKPKPKGEPYRKSYKKTSSRQVGSSEPAQGARRGLTWARAFTYPRGSASNGVASRWSSGLSSILASPALSFHDFSMKIRGLSMKTRSCLGFFLIQRD